VSNHIKDIILSTWEKHRKSCEESFKDIFKEYEIILNDLNICQQAIFFLTLFYSINTINLSSLEFIQTNFKAYIGFKKIFEIECIKFNRKSQILSFLELCP